MQRRQSTTLCQTMLGGGLALGLAASVSAADLSISVTNLTRGIYFTPLLLAAHSPAASVFTPGAPASVSLQAMAEGGDIAALSAGLTALGATVVENPAGGLLAPGARAQVSMSTDGAPDNNRLSLVALLLPSNDGFVGMNSVEIPTEPGTYNYDVNAYDAGTEANDGTRGSGAPGMPGFPAPGPVGDASGTGASGIAATAEGFVHTHRKVLGDTDATGGNSDIDALVHRWLNPVARVQITVR